MTAGVGMSSNLTPPPAAAYIPPMQMPAAVRWGPECRSVRIIDQRALPERVRKRDLRTLDEACDAIRTLAVRGAPAIGIAAAMAFAVAMGGTGTLALAERERRAAHVRRRSAVPGRRR